MRTRRDVLEALAALGVAPDELPIDVEETVGQTRGERHGITGTFQVQVEAPSELGSFEVEPVAVWNGDGHLPAADLTIGDPAANVRLSLIGEDALALAADLVSALTEADEHPEKYTDTPEEL